MKDIIKSVRTSLVESNPNYKGLGPKQIQLLSFLVEHHGTYQTITPDSYRVARSLKKRGLIEFNEHSKQARFYLYDDTTCVTIASLTESTGSVMVDSGGVRLSCETKIL